MDLNEIQSRYKKYYSKVQYESKNGLASNLYHRALEKNLIRNHFENVLEVGAGAGQHLTFVQHEFKNYFLTDLNYPEISPQTKNQISKLSKEGKNIKIEPQNVEKMTYNDSSFDRVITTCVLHHVENPIAALIELRRVTSNNGVINIYAPSDPGLLYRFFQMIISTSSLRNYFSLNEIRFLRASEHRNHISSISGLIDGIFGDDAIHVKHFPKFNFGWNTRLFSVYTIQIRKDCA